MSTFKAYPHSQICYGLPWKPCISHSPYQKFEDIFVSHSGGPNEQFGPHENLSLGVVQGNLNWMPGYSSESSEKPAKVLNLVGVLKGALNFEIK